MPTSSRSLVEKALARGPLRIARADAALGLSGGQLRIGNLLAKGDRANAATWRRHRPRQSGDRCPLDDVHRRERSRPGGRKSTCCCAARSPRRNATSMFPRWSDGLRCARSTGRPNACRRSRPNAKPPRKRSSACERCRLRCQPRRRSRPLHFRSRCLRRTRVPPRRRRHAARDAQEFPERLPPPPPAPPRRQRTLFDLFGATR